MRIGTRGGYHIAEWSGDDEDYRMASLLRRFPFLVEGNYVAIVSWDSGVFVPNESERAEGWTINGDVACSPRIVSATEFPLDGFDELYVFDEPCVLSSIEPLVNYYQFSPIDF